MSVDTRTDEEILAGLDFDHELPCEYFWHGDASEPAAYVIRVTPLCDCKSRERLICNTCWRRLARTLRCRDCGTYQPRDLVVRIIRVIGGAA